MVSFPAIVAHGVTAAMVLRGEVCCNLEILSLFQEDAWHDRYWHDNADAQRSFLEICQSHGSFLELYQSHGSFLELSSFLEISQAHGSFLEISQAYSQ